ncbi:hypothetical protein SAE02_73870 [Skermanella aerolata]|uniref:Uncharacterized protein n=1 Tax=Skermanella aerolata TaxID=393310 RepID=A0A512E3F2_9PROT|nr:hypothetical protein [Skermanella aerolata]KJB90601.1 hypothetical protein N826_38530 [Skermanella aerolata KACC 11604]GEO43239.1 hypothetical protein SAE02_73870 [Skermanella aerolata]
MDTTRTKIPPARGRGGELTPARLQLFLTGDAGGIDLSHGLHQKAQADAFNKAVRSPGSGCRADVDRQWVSFPQPRDDLMRRRMDPERAMLLAVPCGRTTTGMPRPGIWVRADVRVPSPPTATINIGRFPKRICKAFFRDHAAGWIDTFPAEYRQQLILRWSIIAGGGAAD